MILSILATVAVLAAIAVITAALLLAETALVYIALGLGAASVLLLLGALVQGRISEGGSERERSGTDGLGKSSVPSAAAPSQEAATLREYVEPEYIGRVPASISDPVRETAASDTLAEEEPWSEESEFEVPRWQTPTRGEWPEPVTENTDPLPEPEPPVSAFTTEETPFSYSVPGSPPTEEARDDTLTEAEEAVASPSPVEEGLHEEAGLAGVPDDTVEAEEPSEEHVEATTNTDEPEAAPSEAYEAVADGGCSEAADAADLDEPVVVAESDTSEDDVSLERDVVTEEPVDGGVEAITDADEPETAPSGADEAGVSEEFSASSDEDAGALEDSDASESFGDADGDVSLEREAVVEEPCEDDAGLIEVDEDSEAVPSWADEDREASESAEATDSDVVAEVSPDDEDVEVVAETEEPAVAPSGADEAGVSEDEPSVSSDEDAGAVKEDEVSENSEAPASDVAVERDEVPARSGDLAGTAEVVADVEEPEDREVSESFGDADGDVSLEREAVVEEPREEDAGVVEDSEAGVAEGDAGPESDVAAEVVETIDGVETSEGESAGESVVAYAALLDGEQGAEGLGEVEGHGGAEEADPVR